jgi:MFS family permease
MKIRFNWPADMVATYNSILGNCHLPPACLASFYTPQLLKHGRIKTMMVSTLIATVALSVQMIENMWAIILGKTLIGFSFGIISTANGRVIEEYTPNYLLGLVMTLNIFLQQLISSGSIILANLYMP